MSEHMEIESNIDKATENTRKHLCNMELWKFGIQPKVQILGWLIALSKVNTRKKKVTALWRCCLYCGQYGWKQVKTEQVC